MFRRCALQTNLIYLSFIDILFKSVLRLLYEKYIKLDKYLSCSPCVTCMTMFISVMKYSIIPSVHLRLVKRLSKIYLRKSREVLIFTREAYFCYPVFLRLYLSLALEVNKGLFIYCLSFMTVNTIKKQLLRLDQSSIHTLALISAITFRVRSERELQRVYFTLFAPTGIPYFIISTHHDK